MHGLAVALIPLFLVLSLTAAGYWMAQAQTPAPACGDERMQEKVRAIMHEALDDSLKDHVAGLYGVWTSDVKSAAQQARAAAGVNVGVSAYVRGWHAIENWRLPPCR